MNKARMRKLALEAMKLKQDEDSEGFGRKLEEFKEFMKSEGLSPAGIQSIVAGTFHMEAEKPVPTRTMEWGRKWVERARSSGEGAGKELSEHDWAVLDAQGLVPKILKTEKSNQTKPESGQAKPSWWRRMLSGLGLARRERPLVKSWREHLEQAVAARSAELLQVEREARRARRMLGRSRRFMKLFKDVGEFDLLGQFGFAGPTPQLKEPRSEPMITIERKIRGNAEELERYRPKLRKGAGHRDDPLAFLLSSCERAAGWDKDSPHVESASQRIAADFVGRACRLSPWIDWPEDLRFQRETLAIALKETMRAFGRAGRENLKGFKLPDETLDLVRRALSFIESAALKRKMEKAAA
jgi:hypothetical protein